MISKDLEKILGKQKITIYDKVKFRTIFDVLCALFVDKNHNSLLKAGYKINNNQKLWFPNICVESKKAINIKIGYANYLSEDWSIIYQFNSNKTIEQKKKMGSSYIKNKIQFVTFAKINEKTKGIGYHFIGIFEFSEFLNDYTTIAYKRVSDNFSWEIFH